MKRVRMMTFSGVTSFTHNPNICELIGNPAIEETGWCYKLNSQLL